jgi:hypothetical protein
MIRQIIFTVFILFMTVPRHAIKFFGPIVVRRTFKVKAKAGNLYKRNYINSVLFHFLNI